MSTITQTIPIELGVNVDAFQHPQHRQPLKTTGALESYEHFDVTPVIGREFPSADLKEWLEAPNSDELIRDLAITISERGVVFFRKQDGLDNDLQKKLAQKLGELSGKPSTSKLHIHPVHNSGRRLGGDDNEVSVLSSNQDKELYASAFNNKNTNAKEGWHTDIPFENIPSDYALLRLTELPKTGGGDTMYASGYEIYDRISKPYQRFLESLTATYAQPEFEASAKRLNFDMYAGERGAPENVGVDLRAVHPVVRTNPVTGWKSIFAIGQNTSHINDVSEYESKSLMKWFLKLIAENHDLQVRMRWHNVNDVAIWDNRSVFHSATYDFQGSRTGQRAVSLGERPYLDPQSTSRREALDLQREQCDTPKARIQSVITELDEEGATRQRNEVATNLED